ncbi:hypothetical protein ACQKP5_25530 [Pseudomonas vancouverensis]|uniref:hypothetical protein n=1 Tax=Pseudomonas vancouverensis TaxID=95300 RepID=UPI003CFCBF81
MTPEVAVGMGASIRVCLPEKNRWPGKAMFTESHESKYVWMFGVPVLTSSQASLLAMATTPVHRLRLPLVIVLQIER